jgi:hypothetical protein
MYCWSYSTHSLSQHIGGRIGIKGFSFQCWFWFLLNLKYWAWNLDCLISIQRQSIADCVTMWDCWLQKKVLLPIFSGEWPTWPKQLDQSFILWKCNIKWLLCWFYSSCRTWKITYRKHIVNFVSLLYLFNILQLSVVVELWWSFDSAFYQWRHYNFVSIFVV